jgi:hypothetical protein
MRWVLPGGATLGGSNREDSQRLVACRPLAAVLERTSRREAPVPEPLPPMPKVFISYRREDAAAFAGRVFDQLQSHFGRGAVFIDVDSIPFGVDFRHYLTDAVSQCRVLLAIIGDRWTTTGPDGHVRLNDPKDFVRIEIETALTGNIPVIPVLVGKTPMPSEEELPPSLRPLAYRHACNLDSGRDFNIHVGQLIRRLEQLGIRMTTQEAAP